MGVNNDSRVKRRRVRPPSTASFLSSVDARRVGVLTILPAILCLAHACAGANSNLAALWLTAFLAASLVAATCLPSRSARILQSPFLVLVGTPFTLTLAVAVWTIFGATNDSLNGGVVSIGLPRPPTIDSSATLIEIAKLLGLGCAFLIGCIQGATVKRALITAHALVITGGLYGVYAFSVYFAGLQERAGNRLTGGLLSANSAATIFGILLVIAVSLVLRDIGRPQVNSLARARVVIVAACAVILAAALTFTTSRTGISVTGLALATLCAFRVASGHVKLDIRSIGWLRAAAVAAGLVALTAVAQVVLARSVTLEADAATRAVIFASHWQAFSSSPTFGYGLGTFVTINDMIMGPDTYGALWSIRAAHNVYIQWLEEAGVLGALPMFASIGACIGIAVLNARNAGRDRLFIVGLLLADAIVLLHGATDYALQVPSIAATWAFLLGVQCAVGQGVRTPARLPATSS